MQKIIELIVLALIVVAAYPLDTERFVIVMFAVVALYFYTMHNSFNDGYQAALDDRVY